MNKYEDIIGFLLIMIALDVFASLFDFKFFYQWSREHKISENNDLKRVLLTKLIGLNLIYKVMLLVALIFEIQKSPYIIAVLALIWFIFILPDVIFIKYAYFNKIIKPGYLFVAIIITLLTAVLSPWTIIIYIFILFLLSIFSLVGYRGLLRALYVFWKRKQESGNNLKIDKEKNGASE